MVSDCNPSWSAIWLHTAGSYPSVVSMRRRTSVSGDFSERKRRTAARSSSCSSLKAKFMPGLPLGSSLLLPPAPPAVRSVFTRLSTRPGPRATRTPPACLTLGPMGQLEKIWSDAAAEVHQIVVGPMDNNVYILRCRRSGEAMLIDAANEHEELLEICRNLGVNQVVETHGD